LQVVPAYVKSLGDQYEGLYNKKGRGYPDLAAQGLYFAYFWNGTEGTISGTSASCPLTAGIFALVNDALLASGKPALGFLNPWLYKKGYKGLNDITIGSSHGCNVEGFPVTKGWDPITGFGKSSPYKVHVGHILTSYTNRYAELPETGQVGWRQGSLVNDNGIVHGHARQYHATLSYDVYLLIPKPPRRNQMP
jgi:subtilase family serine protease